VYGTNNGTGIGAIVKLNEIKGIKVIHKILKACRWLAGRPVMSHR
jgi:hypothetical protein